MTTIISDYISVSERLEELGARYPIGLALLPANFESAESADSFRQLSTAATVKTLFRNNGIPQDDIVDRAKRPQYIQNNSFELILPTLFVSAAFISENPNLVSIALNVISSYAVDFFKGMSGDKTVKAEVIVEKTKTKTCKKITYSGPVDGLKELAKIVKEASDE